MNANSTTQSTIHTSTGIFGITNFSSDCREAAGRTVAVFNNEFSDVFGFSVFMRLDIDADCFVIFGEAFEGTEVEVARINAALAVMNATFFAFFTTGEANS